MRRWGATGRRRRGIGGGTPPPTGSGGDERNEGNEEKGADPGRPAATLAVARWRATVSPGQRPWEDERLRALACWHLAVAFDRGGPSGFRRHLPRSLARLSDEELAALVDWEAMATLEQLAWEVDPDTAARLGRGAQRLAAWWNARRSGTA